MTVQLDLFNAQTPIANFDYYAHGNIVVYDYSKDMSFDDAVLENAYIMNVPCYKLEDLVDLFDNSKKSIYESDKNHVFWKLNNDKKIYDYCLRISDTKRHQYSRKEKLFIYANSKLEKIVQQKTLWALLKNTIKKKPRLYKKTIKIVDMQERQDGTTFIDSYIADKFMCQVIDEHV